jgi:hypothetical protein
MRPFPPPSRSPSSRFGFLQRLRAAVVVPSIVGLLVLLFRATSLRDLTNDHYMHLAWAQQALFGLLPGLDFVDPGMPLAWAASAVVQAVSAGPLSEAVFSSAMLGLTAALTCWVVTRLTQSHVAGVIAALSAAVLVPRLYNYPKLLVPALTLFLLQRYVEDRSSTRRIAIGVGLAAAILFRHDLGLYACVVALAALALTHRDSPHRAGKALMTVAAATALCLLPYLIYVWWSEGLIEHVRRGIEFSKGESHQLQYAWPTFPSMTIGNVTWSIDDATAFLYYFAWALPLASLAAWRGTAHHDDRDRLPLAVASTLFLSLYLPIILRYPLDQRLPDIATPLMIVGGFVGYTALRRAFSAAWDLEGLPPVRLAAGIVGITVTVLLFAGILNAAHIGGFTRELEETRIGRGPIGVISKIRSIRQDGATWPWPAFWPNSGGFPDAVLWVRACTSADDFVLLTWASPEYFFFAQRKFASGHSMFLPPSAFTTEGDQRFMLNRLRDERPPIALINRTRDESFRRAYPMVASWIDDNYTASSSYRHYDDDEIAIGIRNDLRASFPFGSEGWPCGLVPIGSHNSRPQ